MLVFDWTQRKVRQSFHCLKLKNMFSLYAHDHIYIPLYYLFSMQIVISFLTVPRPTILINIPHTCTQEWEWTYLLKLCMFVYQASVARQWVAVVANNTPQIRQPVRAIKTHQPVITKQQLIFRWRFLCAKFWLLWQSLLRWTGRKWKPILDPGEAKGISALWPHTDSPWVRVSHRLSTNTPPVNHHHSTTVMKYKVYNSHLPAFYTLEWHFLKSYFVG